MPRQTPIDAIVHDVVAIALRQRRHRGIGIAAALLLLVGSAVWSHWRTPVDPSPVDGVTGVVCDRVIDGDTIVVSGNGLSRETLRLKGIDAPEVVHPDFDHNAYFGPEARRYLTDRVAGKSVTLQFEGTEKRDRFGRLLGYVYLDGSDCVNVDLVRDGMAYADRRFKSMFQATLEETETTARKRGVGLWKDVRTEDMPPWRQEWLVRIASRASK